MEEIQLNIIDNLQRLTIWNAGKQVKLNGKIKLTNIRVEGKKILPILERHKQAEGSIK